MSGDAQVAAEPANGPPPPRLRLQHLFLWTALASVLMGVSRNWQADNLGLLPSIATVVWAGTSSIDLSLVVLGCVWRRRGVPFFDQPGHVLALLTVLSLGAALSFVMMNAAWDLGDRSSDFSWL